MREPCPRDRGPWHCVASVLFAPCWGVGRSTSLLETRALCGWRVGWVTGWARWWAGPAEAGITLGCPLALVDQVETQACTPEQNRVCTCRPGWYCTLKRQKGCRLCAPLHRCRPGFGVTRPGMGLEPVGLRDPAGPLLHGHQPISSARECQQRWPAARPLPLPPFLRHARLGFCCALGPGDPERGQLKPRVTGKSGGATEDEPT